MRALFNIYWLPKRGNTADEYEDAYFPLVEGECSGTRFRCAVADGASEGMLSGQWARILTQAYCHSYAPPSFIIPLVGRAQQTWKRWLAGYLRQREADHRPVQWYEEPGLEKGAFATLLGLTLHDSGTWDCLALGDSCLFHVRADRLLTAFPLARAAAFNNRPYLIASNPAHNTRLYERVRIQSGEWARGDCFLLMTDALADWFLRAREAGHAPWDTLRDLAAFDAWAQALRDDQAMRNDDVTLVTLELI